MFSFWLDVLTFGIRPLRFVWAPVIAAVAGGAASGLVGGLMGGGSNKAAKEAASASAELSREQARIGREAWEREKTFWPIEDKLKEESLVAGGLEDQERMAAEAKDSVARSFGDARASMDRAIGVNFNPNSGRFSDAYNKLGLDAAAQGAASENAGRVAARQMGYDKRLQVSQLGKGGAGVAAGSTGAAANTMAGLSNTYYNRGRQQMQDAAYFTQPIVKAGLDAFGKWYSTPSSQGSTFASAGGGTAASGTPFGYSYAAPAAAPRSTWSGYARGGMIDSQASLGDVRGPGTDRSDSIPIRASDGEFVLNAEAVKALGKANVEAINLVGRLRQAAKAPEPGLEMAHGGKVAGYDRGGHVKDTKKRKPLKSTYSIVKSGTGAPVTVNDYGLDAMTVGRVSTGTPTTMAAPDPVLHPNLVSRVGEHMADRTLAAYQQQYEQMDAKRAGARLEDSGAWVKPQTRPEDPQGLPLGVIVDPDSGAWVKPYKKPEVESEPLEDLSMVPSLALLDSLKRGRQDSVSLA